MVGYEVYSEGLMPYAGKTNDQVCSMVTSGHRLQQPESCPDAIFRILLRCWSFKPSNRVDFTVLTQHLSNVIQRLRQGATDADLMQSSTIRSLARRAARGSKQAVPYRINSPQTTDVDQQYLEVNPYVRSTRASEHSVMSFSLEESRRARLDSDCRYSSAATRGEASPRSSLDSNASRPMHDADLAGHFVMLDDITVSDGIVVVEPGSAANPKLAHLLRYGTMRGGTYLELQGFQGSSGCDV